ncbi:hypothetical protein IGI04_036099 [Brassica rapa subsp. trilocularis]|uniref:Uncharacterized protein n=1 Tax=Brassica rapa subsp. trilocularis TaxID=1813537 RepID=A0ABQ7LGI8_BRACM|nr:hypothetical protein IGI04_036099 [Brassica rapa subsp. trilocularis]
MKRNDNKEFQYKVIFSPKLVKNSSGHFRNLAWPWVLSLLNPKCRVSDVSTSIDGTCVHRSILIFICRGISWYRSSALMRIDRLFLLSSTSTWSARVKCPLSSKMLQSHSFTPKCT